MRSMQQQLGVLGTISAFAYRQTQGNHENLRRDGRSQDLPDTDFQPAVRHLEDCKICVRPLRVISDILNSITSQEISESLPF